MKYSRSIKVWLFVGLVMVFVQVIVGGITRLTESGLSITKWEVVSGTLPPMSDEAWLEEFEKYKETPQYREINEGMNLSDFKFIYFWEYVHRLWARFMGFVFLIPFIYFYMKGMIDIKLLKNLSVVVFFAGLAAIFGWIMVASGLVERPWVDAYKLSLHLLIAIFVFISLFWTYLETLDLRSDIDFSGTYFSKGFKILFGITIFQLMIGGILSGMKAAVIYPTWPDMNGEFIPTILLNVNEWNMSNFYNYDKNAFMPAVIHFLHRNMAYLLGILAIYLGLRLNNYVRNSSFRYIKLLSYFIIGIIVSQILIGIITVISSIGSIPVLWGVLHQAGALIVISIFVFAIFVVRIKKV